ncbi:hypothetical protein ASG63_16430 [Methylobacterium sp. Leaf94]|uniref:hypothetical protein n=1 Tax=Methylobacterium sp. Leaf94 TaxID=1736250 RepID=UPI0006F8F8CC|nr:hypothetical protein [Methylobacterium sp. Leaf94]KQU31085.1 hypothetical protein ASG63_16430 [Methylobacterium sp. Leaf94]
MTEPCTKSNTTTVSDGSLADHLAQGISDCYARFEEAQIYEIAVAMSVTDPYAARSLLNQRPEEPAFPLLLNGVLATIQLRIEAAAAARDRLLLMQGPDRPGGDNDKQRELQFRRDPGAYLPGAIASIRKLTASAFWHVSIDGRLVPCCYVSRAHLVGDIHDMVVLLDEEPYYKEGVVIGSPETEEAIAGLLPANVRFVAVPLATGGRA